jgi:3-oxoacyl-[acyl-carrier-protein] synthase II
MERRVVITGIGVISPLGDSSEALHTALCEGRSSLQPITQFNTDGLMCQQAHALATFTPETYLGKNPRALDRTSQLVTAAATLALEQSGWSLEMRRQHEVGLVLGTMFCSVHTIAQFDRRGLTLGPNYVSPMDFANTVINAAAGQAAIWHDLRGVNSTIAGGITSGLQALAYAIELIRSGQATALLAGGAEELCFESFCGFDRAGLLCRARYDGAEAFPIPFDARRNGFTLGEGAALLMLEDATIATARGASVMAEIRGHGSAYDLARGTASQTAVEAIARAMRLALQDAQMDPSDIVCLSASANGSVLADRYETQAIATVFQERTHHLPVTAVKSMLGETLGASGGLQAVALLAAMRDDVLPGIRHLEQVEEGFPLHRAGPGNQRVPLRNGLINSVGLDGNCCALVITQTSSGQ